MELLIEAKWINKNTNNIHAIIAGKDLLNDWFVTTFLDSIEIQQGFKKTYIYEKQNEVQTKIASYLRERKINGDILLTDKESVQNINVLVAELNYLQPMSLAVNAQINLIENRKLGLGQGKLLSENQKQLTKTKQLLTQTQLELKSANERIASLSAKMYPST